MDFQKVTQQIDNIFPELVQLRRDLHAHPELYWEETRTTEKIIRFLESHNVNKISRPLETGVVADLQFKQDAPTVLLRADIDALPIEDLKEVEYKSQNRGVCHACGHDVHTAVHCGIAAVLTKFGEQLPVNVRLVFQPAEEPIPSGAPKMIEKGVLNNIDSAMAMHVDPLLSLGTISLTEGWVNAQSIKVEWALSGEGGHSARPHLTQDPILAGSQLIQQAYQLAYRRWNRLDSPVVLSITGFESGEEYNVIPKYARLMGTLRLTNIELKSQILDELLELNNQIEKIYGVKLKFDARPGAPPVVNDPDLIKKLTSHLTAWKESSIQLERYHRSTGGDDFGWYSREVPSAMIRFGTLTDGYTSMGHTGHFDVPADVIQIAVKFFIFQLLRWNTK